MKKIAIIGASYLQLPLVKKAKEMGIETHCFAWEKGAVCKDVADFFYPISIIDKELILKECKKININGITSIASDAAVSTICYVAQEMGLSSNNYKDALVVTNKYLMRKCFEEHKVNSPLFRIAEENIATDQFRYPLIIKPTDRSGSLGVMKIDNENELNEAVTRAKKESFSKQAIIEEYITGSEVSVETISWQGRHFILAITDKVTTEKPYFVELEHHQPSKKSKYILEKVKSETSKALSALNINYGASHAEFKITPEGEIFIIEVGARMGGDFIGSDLVQLSTGYDFLKGVIECSLGYFEEPVFKEKKYSGVYFLCEETKRLLPIIQNSSNYKEIVSAKITDLNLRTIQCSADRSGYFLYQGEKRFEI
ncbi:MAG: ATP-grasp domain-containing protein [Bacteroidetes bacterium]|nr:ATP-grasp domain-containing protein [Bacteroidota bacterium]